MSCEERDRMKIMAGVKAKELSQVQAAELMSLSYRQAKRLWRRYRDQGDASLVHRLRGKPGMRCKPAVLRAKVLKLCAQECYADFGPTLLAEELQKEGIVVDHDTVRRWLLASGKRTVRRRRQQHQRKRHKGQGRARGRDHQRWPNAYFAELGLISLALIRAQAANAHHETH